jgi:hypothetical protein
MSEWGAEGFFQVAKSLGFSQPAVVGFLGFRLFQNILIFGLAWLMLRRFGFDRYTSAFGLGLIAWAMTQSLFNAALSFNTYGDLVFYLAAGVLILDRRYAWILPLTILAAINRETSGLIPVMLLAVAVAHGPGTDEGRRALRIGVASLVAFGATYGIVRLAVGPAFFIEAQGHSPGIEMLRYNAHAATLDFLFQTLNILPLLALVAVRRWPVELKAFALAIVPVWLVAHTFAAVLAESRLMLVPLAVVFVPGALAGLARTAPAEPVRAVPEP